MKKKRYMFNFYSFKSIWFKSCICIVYQT